MRNTIWSKKIPSFLGLLFLALSVVSISWMSKNVIQSRGKASASVTPKNVQISNITDTSFSVSYITDDSALGTIGYASDPKLGKVGLDDRDQQGGTPAPHKLHHITLQHLDPHTKYYFTIISGDASVLNNGVPYEVTTAAPTTLSPAIQAPIVGKVNLPDGNIPVEGIAYVSSDSSQSLSVLLQPDGGYMFPLTSLRTRDLNAFASPSATTVFHLVVESPTLTSHASVLASQTNPVPLISLSNDYDFSVSTNPFLANQISTSSSSASLISPTASNAGFQSFTGGSSATLSAPSIVSPKTEEKFSDQQPMFTGTAIPNESVDITIESSQQISTSVQADANGSWQFRPSTKLAPGQHTISIVTKGIDGIVQTITRTFTVYASGSQFTEPSVSPSPSPTASPSAMPIIIPTPTTSPTVLPTATPTVVASASATPTIVIPTALPTTPTSVVLTNPPLPKTGTSSLLLGGIAVVLSIGAGLMIFFVTSGAIPL